MSYAIGYYSLGQEVSEAGPINGIATLRADIQRSAASAAEVYGADLSYDRGAFRELLRRFKEDPDGMTGTRLDPPQVQNFVVGVISECASAVARAEQLAHLPVRGPAQQEENRRGQAELVGSARIMLDACNTMLASATPIRDGASGLGLVITTGTLIAIAVVSIIVGVAAVAAITYCYDAMQRMIQARATADRICEDAEGGCSAEQYAEIVRRLQLGPFDRLARGGEAAVGRAGTGVATGIVIASVGAVLLGGAYFLFGTEQGRRTLAGMKKGRQS